MTSSNRILLFLMMFCAIPVVGQLYLTIPLGNEIAQRFDITPDSASWAGTVFGLGYAAGVLVFGLLSDRYGRRRIILLGLLALSGTTIAVALASDFSMLLLCRALQGSAAGTFAPTALSLIAETLPARRVTLGISLMAFSFLAASPISQMLAGQSGIEMTQLMFMLASFYLVGAIGIFMTTSGAPKSSSSTRTGDATPLRTLFHDHRILAAWGAALSVLFSFVAFHSGIQFFGPGLGLDMPLFRLAALPTMLCTLIVVPLSKRFSARRTTQCGLLLSAVSITLAMSGQAPMLIAASTLLSAGIALTLPGLIGIISGLAVDSNRGTAIAIYTFILFIGASLAPLFTSLMTRFGLIPLCLSLAGCLLVAIVVLEGRPRPSIPSPSSL